MAALYQVCLLRSFPVFSKAAIQACLRCFSYFHQTIALEKLWEILFISSKKLFLILKIFRFLYSPLPLFSLVISYSRRWLKINLKVSDVINCLNKNWKTHCLVSSEGKKVWYWNLVNWVLSEEHFLWEKYAGNVHQKLAPDQSRKRANLWKKLSWKLDILKVDYQKTFKKFTWLFLLYPVPFYGQNYKKQKALGTSYHSLFGL